MKIAFSGLGIIPALIVLVVIVGALLPEHHHATHAAQFHQPPQAIWTAMTDVQQFPTWRSTVKRVESLTGSNGLPAWREFDSHGYSIPMQTVESDAPRRLITNIADPKLPFGGSWNITITPMNSGSEVRITEDGEVRNPVFRFMSRFVFGETATMNTYLHDLGRKFGENIQVQN